LIEVVTDDDDADAAGANSLEHTDATPPTKRKS
jgi:hypothetical protein